MRKKLLSILLAVALIVTVFPPFMAQQVEAAGTYFIFDGLGYSKSSPTKTNDLRIDLSGTYNSVAESSIVYSVEQILDEDTTPMKVGLSRLNTTAGLAAIDGAISILGMELFPGLNRVTFSGRAGFSDMKDTFYIEYIDNPVIYDLKFLGSGGDYMLNGDKVVITEDMTAQPGSGQVTMEGKAPNADQVFVYINDNFSKAFSVVNNQFFASGLELEKGKNTVKFVVSNDDQNVETTKEFIYFNGDATFFDVTVNDGNLEDSPRLEGPAGDALLLSGKVVVPNYYVLKPAPPKILTAIFTDEDTSGDWSDNDTLTITFDKDTNEAAPGGLVNDVDVDDLIEWDADEAGDVLNLGDDYSATWTDAHTLVVTVDDANGNNIDEDQIGTSETIGIKPGADLRTLDEISEPVDFNNEGGYSQLTGTIIGNTSVPYILSVEAGNGSNSPGLADDDHITITFNEPTNRLGRPVSATVDQDLIDDTFTFSDDIGTSYHGIWDTDTTLRIVISDIATNNWGPGDTIELVNGGATLLTDQATPANPAQYENKEYVVKGSFGESASSVYEPNPDPGQLTTEDDIRVEIFGVGEGVFTIPAASITDSDDFYESDPLDDAEYFVLEFEDVNIGTMEAAETFAATPFAYRFDQMYSLIFYVKNYVKSAVNGQLTEDSQSGFAFTPRNSTNKYIEQVRHISNLEAVLGTTDDYDDLNGVNLNGLNYEVFESPFDLELQANQDVTTGTNNITISVVDENGVEIVDAGVFAGSFDVLDVTDLNEDTIRVVRIKELPRVGYQVLRISIAGGPAFDQPISYVFGPYVSFDDLYNGMTVEKPNDTSTPEPGIETLDFDGQLINVDPSTIRDYNDGGTQTLFMTINGKAVNIRHDGGGKFSIDDNNDGDDTDNNNEIGRSMLNTGKNTIVVTYRYNTAYYKRTVIVNVFPTDFPEVPAEGSTGVFPSSFSDPRKDPSRFTEMSEGLYATKEKAYSVYGSFRLLEMSNVGTDLPSIDADQYRFEILKNGVKIIDWDLSANHFETDNGQDFNTGGRISNFNVVYDRANDYFTFELDNQTVEDNTGSVVYTFVAYKETANTFYRMELQTIDTPYTILRPFFPEQKVINQNYIDVVIHSEGAESIVIDDFVGEKIDFDEDNDGDVDFIGAFKIRVEDLKPGKASEIEFTITLASGEEIEDSFEVLYTPTNIQGAQHLQAMGNKISAFNKSFELSFPRGTNLTNKVDPTDRNAVQLLYANHDLMMGIANPYNGIVDRRLYEDQPSGFANKIALSELEFNATLPERFTMASPLYWIDAGLGDDPGTFDFDPVDTGLLPFQFPATGLPSYMERDADQVLIPTQRGELTLAFDPNMVQNAGTQVSVFRYDPILQMWENVGGEVNTRNNTVTVPFDQFGYYSVMKLQYSYVDITSHPYARDEMEAIYAKGVMNSFDDQDFGANNNITRGEFAAMIVKALQIPLNYDNRNLHFDDVSTVIVPGALWDYRYIETAAREGILQGTEPRIFQPYAQLTREQAAVVLARALELDMEVNREDIDDDLSSEFVDYTEVYIYARPAVLAVLDEELMKGSPIDPTEEDSGMVFQPKDNLLRSDAAIMLTRVMASLDLLPEMN